ncbi:MAG TPA: type II toxin-antitoxin system prevent-host-death family antitoxin [Caulobacteraceae bacterium]|jgi:prevent-host-death family protein|nr:type II toxin-antitoxin system prevent-host-death family antitoxin [Caulobacteraceae bacterium]
MDVPITEAKAQLTELVRRAEAGEEVVLTRHGRPAARIVPTQAPVDRAARRAALEAIWVEAAVNPAGGPDAARSQDFLYDEDGLPA